MPATSTAIEMLSHFLFPSHGCSFLVREGPRGRRSTLLQLCRQPGPAAGRVLVVALGAGADLVGAEAPEQLFQRDPTLQPRQRRADAVVDPLAEADVALRLTLEVELSRGPRSGARRGWRRRSRARPGRRLGIVPPAISTSSRATRASPWTGASQRTSSSTARVANSGSAAIRRRSSGRCSSRCRPLPTRQAVVSTPAMTRMKVSPRASSGAEDALVFGPDQDREQVVARSGPAGRDLLGDQPGQPLRGFARDRGGISK